jgi:hypothetical protein
VTPHDNRRWVCDATKSAERHERRELADERIRSPDLVRARFTATRTRAPALSRLQETDPEAYAGGEWKGLVEYLAYPEGDA